ncbi:MAG: polysaccharide biosynthesis tyrosine autokinase, partial [Gemmataceae bacterium]
MKLVQARMQQVDVESIDTSLFEEEVRKDPTSADLLNRYRTTERAYLLAKETSKVEALFALKKQTFEEAKSAYEQHITASKSGIERKIRGEAKEKLKFDLSAQQDLKVVIEAQLSKDRETREITEKRIDELNNGGIKNKFDLDDLTPEKEQLALLNKELLHLDMESKRPSRVVVRDDATVIWNYNLKQKMLLSTLVAIVGFIGVMVLVAYLEWRSRRVDSVEQVVNELGLRIIGTIPAFPSRASLKAGEADQNQNWRFILNESVNSTRTMLLHTAKTQSMQVIMVTSAMQGEGKTSLASQLATSMATAGLRTLILDCDLRNPSMHRLFDVQLTPGCSEILCQEVDVSDAVQPTTVPNLWMIPAGQCSNRVITALAQGHPLETLFNRLRGQFDFIVVDSCPVLPVADSLLVGQHVDGVVISVLQDISQLP